MKSYYVVKKLSKSLILLSLLAVIISGGTYFVSKSKIGADTNTAVTKDYEIVMSGSTVDGIIANNLSSEEILNFDFDTNPDANIEKFTGDCRLGSNCYVVWNTNVWNNPSIALSDGLYTPVWAFLNEVKAKAEKVGDTAGIGQIKNVRANYLISAFNKSLLPYFDFTSTSGVILIPQPQFFEALAEAGIEEKDPYVDFYQENGKKMAKLKFASSYPGASNNSAWLAAANFELNSVIKPYKDAGLDATQYEAAINAAKTTYALSISKEDKSKVLSLKYPANVLLTEQSAKTFEYNIDTKQFAKPSSGYKTKVFIKPASKKDSNVYILLGPLAESSYKFSWSEAVSSGYIDNSNKKVSTTGDDYNLNFPQQYIVRAITYDGDTEKDSILTTIQTQSTETISAIAEVTDGNSVLKISAKPVAIKQGNPVTATIEAVNSDDPNKQITKVILYACSGTSSAVATNDSSTCVYKNKDGSIEDAIKSVFTLGSNLDFKDGKATLTSTWNTSGSAIGNHALMAKAFTSSAGNSYISGSKTAVTVQVTNSDVGAAAGSGGSGSSGSFSNLLAGLFSKNASSSPTGSSIRTTGELATRIVNIFLVVIGAFSVIAIIVGGIFYITAGGDQKKAERGKKTVLYACIGIAIATFTYVIEASIIDIIDKLT